MELGVGQRDVVADGGGGRARRGGGGGGGCCCCGWEGEEVEGEAEADSVYFGFVPDVR